MAKELMKILYNPNPAEEMSIDQIIRYVDTRLQKQKEREGFHPNYILIYLIIIIPFRPKSTHL
jgi:hypothetical protein